MLLSIILITVAICFRISSCDIVCDYCLTTSTVNIAEFTPAAKDKENIAIDLDGQKLTIGDCVYLEFDIQINSKVNQWYEKVFTIMGDISEQWPFPGFQVDCQRGSFRFYYNTDFSIFAFESQYLINCNTDHNIHHIQFFVGSGQPIFTFDGKIYGNTHDQPTYNGGHKRFDKNVQIYSTLYYEPLDLRGNPIHGQTPMGVLDGVISSFEYISITEPCPCEENPPWESCDALAKDKYSKQIDNFKNGNNNKKK
eukprot:118839_1